MRIYELSKELGIENKVLIAYLQEQGADVRVASNSISKARADDARNHFGQPVVEAPVEETEPELEPEVAAEESAQEPEEPAVEAEPEPEPTPEPPPPPPEPEKPKGPVVVGKTMIVRELAELLNLKPNQLIAELMGQNIFATITQTIDFRVAKLVASKHGVQLIHEAPPPPPPPPAPVAPPPPPQPVVKTLKDETRPPVVTFLGHVDHGKTSLLDKIRHSHVAADEHGGITQHTGAYTVEHNDQRITFIDTPGHAAFTNMRARGANLTDIAVIIIAADDGIMTQTREAIQHARAANVAILVAINKIDVRNANVERVKQQLQQENLAPEDWGGQTIVCPVSAHTGEGIDQLLEMIALQAEVLELKANPHARPRGYVIEARLEPGMGPTANVLVKEGTLKMGDVVVCGPFWGRVKALISDKGVKLRTAGPSMAVKLLGLNNVPEAGAEFVGVDTDRQARTLTEERSEALRIEKLGTPKRKASLEDLLRQTDFTEKKELTVIVKADVQGTLEAILQSFDEIESEKIDLRPILSGVGNITENDVVLASASDAIVLGFNVASENQANAAAKREGVEIRLYSIIYEMMDDIRQAMTGRLSPIQKENVIGHAEVRQIFDISKKGRIAGCMVIDGRVSSRSRARVKRKNDVLYEGTISSLKRFQHDAADVREGQECGIRVDQFADYEVGDIIEFFEVQQIAQQL